MWKINKLLFRRRRNPGATLVTSLRIGANIDKSYQRFVACRIVQVFRSHQQSFYLPNPLASIWGYRIRI